jgi:hypothetical protein
VRLTNLLGDCYSWGGTDNACGAAMVGFSNTRRDLSEFGVRDALPDSEIV